MNIPEIKIEDYHYDLPPDRIPNKPLEQRDASKLLVYNKGRISESAFRNLNQYLPVTSTLVFNNTKVFPARLIFSKSTGALIEIFCLQPINQVVKTGSGVYSMRWECMVGNLKKWKNNEVLLNEVLAAILVEKRDDTCLVDFEWKEGASFFDILDKYAELPLPPYMNRKANEEDKERYQTVYAKYKGSVAAPTAGLHFTDQVFKSLENKGVKRVEVTLHVGAGTFKPVKASRVSEHLMHTEPFTVKKESIKSFLANPDLIAVGTTSMRVLESLYVAGSKIAAGEKDLFNISQWDGFKYNDISAKEALERIMNFMEVQDLDEITGKTQIFILPGFQFKFVKGIITNFHQPSSTLILLVAAFIGEDWRKVYDYALQHEFRFLSYGDSSLLIP